MESYSKEWWAERIHLIKAFVDGEEIVYMGYEASNPDFSSDIRHYKIKPKTIKVNGFEVPEPVKEELILGQYYFIPSPTNFEVNDLFEDFSWDSDRHDKSFLDRGIIHLTKENAIAHAKAMLGINPNA